MSNIYDPTNDFNFGDLTMTSPASITGGNHFSKFLINHNSLYIQTPKCSTKSGLIKSGKKIYTDLVFTNIDEEFIQWIETLEITTRKLIYANREKWFDTELDEDDIESYFAPTVKLFKSGKQYLVRVNVDQRVNGSPAVKIYDESETDIDPETLNDKTTMITIVEVKGVRCSAKSFQIELVMKQAMVIKPVEIFDKCIIKDRTGAKQDNAKSLATTIQMGSSQTDNQITNTQVANTLTTDTMTNSPQVADMLIADTLTNSLESMQDEDSQNEPLDDNEKSLASEEPNIQIELKETNNDIVEIHNDSEPYEINLDDTNINEEDTIYLKDKTEVYYEMYRNARKKAKLAKSLALSSFMEARRIKNMYMLDDLEDSDDEGDLENLENLENDE
jgi:hypothetical protein